MDPLNKTEWHLEEKKDFNEAIVGHNKRFPEQPIYQIRDQFMNLFVNNLGTENRPCDAKLSLYVEAMESSDNFGMPLEKAKDLAAMSPSICEDEGESSRKMKKIEVGGKIGKEQLEEATRKKSNKGQPWSMEEHELFLYGMQKYGRGKWRRICRELLKTRTPTQVASHAQKYFNRPKTPSNRRRSSIHDIRLPNKDVVLNTNTAIRHFTNSNYTIPNGNYGLFANSNNGTPKGTNWGLFANNTNETPNSNYGYFANNLACGSVSDPIGLSRNIHTEPVRGAFWWTTATL
ncbi:hypothetical protein LUZ63_011258 [Rhynchospora breviuscula]|uniref:Uncharacterized protein n=1 Tax=Rhynchospora breviuscula TaxID=2022672 RepID=A0A9Q0HQU6_9POAL|nr:hypothetical protein LUZ63_011258 [Rhynchospora breviuscula]